MPTPRQTRTVEIMVDNGRNGIIEPMSKVLAKVGYSKAVQRHPDRVTKSKTFQELLNCYIPENKLTKKHRELLDAVRLDKFMFPNSMSNDEIGEVIEAIPESKLVNVVRKPPWACAYYITPDYKIQTTALELGYKVRRKLGNYKDESNDPIPHEEIEAFITWVRETIPMSK